MGVPRKVALMTYMSCALDQSIAPDPMRGVKPTKARCRPIPIGTQTQKNKAASIKEAAADRAPRRGRTQRRRRARARAERECKQRVCDPCIVHLRSMRSHPTDRPTRPDTRRPHDLSTERSMRT